MKFGPGETVSVRQDSWIFGRFFRLRGTLAPGQKPEPALAGQTLCRLSCTVSCIFPARRCFSPQRVVLYFYLYPRAFLGGCAGNPRGVARMCGTKRPVLTLGEHRRHWGHKTRNALGLERGAWVRLPPSPPEGRPVRYDRTSFFTSRRGRDTVALPPVFRQFFRQRQRLLHRGGAQLLGLGIQMSVDVGCGGDVAVTQPFLDLLHGHALLEQQAGAGVPCIVKVLFAARFCAETWEMPVYL